MKLGKLQTAWVAALRKHPERQHVDSLGEKSNNNDTIPYYACCLGELHLCAHRLAKKKLPFNIQGNIEDVFGGDEGALEMSHDKYGLYNMDGEIHNRQLDGCDSLAEANDGGVSWYEIADFIEEHPESIFTKSV